MRFFCALFARRWCACLSWGLLVAAVSCAMVERVGATEVVSIVRVEEDWELVLATPSPASNSPQITCAMSPVSGHDGHYVTFELNHQSQPGYATGGLHLHAWDGEYLLGSCHAQTSVSLQEPDETIRWTQVMTLQDGILTYEVLNGASTTWGSFGQGELKVTVHAGLSDLNGYSVETSLAGSGVGYGSNRVTSFVLKRVRLTTDTGDLITIDLNTSLLTAD